MKNIELKTFLNSLNTVKNLKGAVFAYAVGKNINKVTSTLKELYESREYDEGFKKFQKERNELLLGFAKLDEDEKPIEKVTPQGTSYDFEDEAEVEAAVNSLVAEHQEAVDAQQVLDDDFKNLMDEDIDFEIHKVKVEALPQDITGAQIASIECMIFEE